MTGQDTEQLDTHLVQQQCEQGVSKPVGIANAVKEACGFLHARAVKKEFNLSPQVGKAELTLANLRTQIRPRKASAGPVSS